MNFDKKNVSKFIYKLYKKETVIDVMIYFGQLKGMSRIDAKKEAEDFLERVKLTNKAKMKVDKLSGGQQQRLCIARLLPLKPKLLLLDEPCSALDPAGIEAIETLIKDLKKDYSILIVTHSMSQAKRVSDETIFMYMGELVEMGKTKDVFENPKEARTAAYIEGRFG